MTNTRKPLRRTIRGGRPFFFADPAIQQRWRSALYLPDSLSLKPDWSLDAYEQAIYRPTLRLDAQQLLDFALMGGAMARARSAPRSHPAAAPCPAHPGR